MCASGPQQRKRGRTVESPSLLVVAHLVVPEREVVQALAAPGRLGAVYLCAARQSATTFVARVAGLGGRETHLVEAGRPRPGARALGSSRDPRHS